MMRYLKRISSDLQVFITTHSTNFLDTAEMKNVYLNRTTQHWYTAALFESLPPPDHELVGLQCGALSRGLQAGFSRRCTVARRLIAGRRRKNRLFVECTNLMRSDLVSKPDSTRVQLLDFEEAETQIPRELGIRLSAFFSSYNLPREGRFIEPRSEIDGDEERNGKVVVSPYEATRVNLGHADLNRRTARVWQRRRTANRRGTAHRAPTSRCCESLTLPSAAPGQALRPYVSLLRTAPDR